MLVSSRTTNVLLVLVLAVGVSIVAILATGVRGGPIDPPGGPTSTDSVRLPGTPISGPTTISVPGHYYLTRDVQVSGSVTAITINASKVSFDLGGFTIDGTFQFANSVGIDVVGQQQHITIRNGIIKDFDFAIIAGDDAHVLIDEVRALSNGRGFTVGPLTILSDCVSSDNTETGIYVPTSAFSTTVKDCVVIDNNYYGIAIDGNIVVVTDSEVRDNTLSDIYINQGDFAGIRNNTVGQGRVEVGSAFHRIVDNFCTSGGFIIAGQAYFPDATDPHANVFCSLG